MSDAAKCPNCGSSRLEVGSSGQICPRCALLLAIEDEPVEQRRIAHYEVLREIGRGGMGVVYKAYQPSLNRVLALKVLTKSRALDETMLQRFRQEAQAAAQLNHPNVVTIYDIGSDDGSHYIAMEYINGRDLWDLIAQEKHLNLKRSLTIMRQVLDALGAAHARQIVHRDIKPQNIMIEANGRVRVLDFGLAHMRTGDSLMLTLPGSVIGTPAYMSPEQCRGQRAEPYSDLYACTVVLYNMLTGRIPFQADELPALIHNILHEPTPSILDRFPAAPESLDRLLKKGMAKEPGDRFATADEMREAMEQLLAEIDQPDVRPPSQPVSKKKSLPRWVWATSAAALLLVLIVFIALQTRPFSKRSDSAMVMPADAIPTPVAAASVTDPSSEQRTRPAPPQEQTVSPLTIPDPALARALRSAVGKVKGELTKNDLFHLDSLNIPNGPITDLTGLELAVNLRHLELGYNPIADYSTVMDLRKLKVLMLQGLPWDPSLEELATSHPTVVELHLVEMDITDSQLAVLNGHPRLAELHLVALNRVTDAGVLELKDLPNMRRLELHSNRQLTPRALGVLSHHPYLQFLQYNLQPVSDPSFDSLGDLKQLRYLYLQYTDVTTADLRHLTGHPQLRELHLDGSTQLNDACFKVMKTMPNLDMLSLNDTASISPQAIEAFRAQHPAVILQVDPALEAGGVEY